MNVAVKFWSDVENPRGIPGEWPADVREIGLAVSYSKEPGDWQIMSIEDYKRLVSERQPIKDAFDIANPEPTDPVQPSLEERMRDIEQRLEALERA
jgi:hypothetical protein